MDLYFLRHGKAVEIGPDAPDDFRRALTPDGIKEMQAEAEALESLGIRPDVILTSPLVRAKQTAEIVAKRLGVKKGLIESDLLAPGCQLEQLRKLLDQHGSAKQVMLVGHEPDFSSMIGDLIGPEGASMELKKGGLAVVHIERTARKGVGTLLWLVPPKVLIRVAERD